MCSRVSGESVGFTNEWGDFYVYKYLFELLLFLPNRERGVCFLRAHCWAFECRSWERNPCQRVLIWCAGLWEGSWGIGELCSLKACTEQWKSAHTQRIANPCQASERRARHRARGQREPCWGIICPRKDAWSTGDPCLHKCLSDQPQNRWESFCENTDP